MLAMAPIAAISAPALTLTEALFLARQTDPQLLAAKVNLTAAENRAAQALGALRPQVTLAVTTTANQRNYQVMDSPLPAIEDTYNSNSAQLNVTQSLWRRPNNIALTQARSVAAQTGHQLTGAEQDMLVRLAQAWFDLMSARDALAFNAAQVTATQHQSEQANRAAALGLASGPMVEEALYKLAQAQADLSGAQSELSIKQGALEQIIGPLASVELPRLSDNFVASDPRNLSLPQWLSHVEVTNPAVLAGTRALDAANDEIRKQRAGHQPTLDMVFTYGRNAQAVGSFPGQAGYGIDQQSIALQLNVPLYSGGTQNAKVTEAMAMRDKAMHELEGARRAARLAATQAWHTWQAGYARHAAAQQSLKFTSLSLQAAIRGRDTGAKAELDVLQARQQWVGAARDLQKARHDMTTSYIKLHATTGQLIDEDLTSLDSWFEPGSQAAQRR